MEPQLAQQVKAYAFGRIGIGAVAIVAPRSALRRWLGPGSTGADTRLLARSAGVRDVAIGVGTILALNHDTPVRGWLEAAAMADAGDLVAALLGLRGGLPKMPLVGTALAAAAGAAYGRQLVGRLPSS